MPSRTQARPAPSATKGDDDEDPVLDLFVVAVEDEVGPDACREHEAEQADDDGSRSDYLRMEVLPDRRAPNPVVRSGSGEGFRCGRTRDHLHR